MTPTPTASAAVDLLDVDAVSGRVKVLNKEATQRKEALEVLRGRLAHVEEDVPAPGAPAPLPDEGALGEAPTKPTLDEVLGTTGPHTEAELARAEEERTARHAEAIAGWERRRSERAVAVAALAEATRAYKAALAAHPAALEEARERLARETDEGQVRLDAQLKQGRHLKAVAAFLDKTPPAGRTALRSLRRAGELERGRVGAILALDPEIGQLQQRVLTLADRASTGGLVGWAVEREELERAARGAAKVGQARRHALTAVAKRLEDLGSRLDARWERLWREVLLSLDSPGVQERIEGLYSARLEAERRARRLLGGRRPGQGPASADVAKALTEALPHPDGISSVSDGRSGLGAGERALGAVQAHLDEQDLAMAWRELAFDRQAVAALGPHISEELRSELHGVGLHARWLVDARIEILEAQEGLITWARSRWGTLRNLSVSSEQAARIAWLLVTLLAFGLALRLRAPLRSGFQQLVRAVVTAPGLRRTAGAAVRWSVLLEAVISPGWTFAAGLLAFEFLGDDLPELVAGRAVFFWWMGFRLASAALVGLTTRASLGRPPLLPTDAQTSQLLDLTWRRIGLPVVITGILDELIRAWILGGVMPAIVRSALWILLTAWALWSLVAWRSRLGQWWLDCAANDGPEERIAQWYVDSSIGALLSPAVVARLLLHQTWQAVRSLLAAAGAMAWFQARRLRREAKQQAPESVELRSATIPMGYREAFRAGIDIQAEGTLPKSRALVLDKLNEVVDRWQREPGPGAAVLTAESGMGKTVVLDHLQSSLEDRVPVFRARLTEKILRPADLSSFLAPVLGLDPTLGPDGLAEALDDRSPRVVIVDDVHHLFMRTVGGYDAFAALVRLVVASGDDTFWVLAIGEYAWDFLSRRHPGEHHFDDVIQLPPLGAEELEGLITRRHETTGFELEFDEVIHSGGGGTTDEGLRLVESVDGFFLLLTDASGGNPDIAQRLWLDALSPGDNGTLRVGLFPSPNEERLRDAGAEALFTLAGFILHETLTTEELATVTNVGRGEAEASVERLRARGVLTQEVDEPRGRLTVSPRWYRPTIRLLRRKHLL